MNTSNPQSVVIKLSDDGRIILPTNFLNALNVKIDDELVISLEGLVIKIMTQQEARRQAQDFFKSLAPENVSLVDELIDDRRIASK